MSEKCLDAVRDGARPRWSRAATAILSILTGLVPVGSAECQEGVRARYPEHVARYLNRLYDDSRRELAFRDDDPGGFARWQRDARAALESKLGLDRMAAEKERGDFVPPAGREANRPSVPRFEVELDEARDLGDYLLQRGRIETEPEVRIPFWLLKPKGEGPWPLGIFPHGHDGHGHDTTAGVFSDEAVRKKALAEDRDVAVQAVRRGMVAIAPAVRGLSVDGVPDIGGRHGKRDCRSHAVHCLLAGRTAVGERVWDMQRLLDWASTLPEVDGRGVLMMGNSGGGMVTLFTAAVDERIRLAVPSCSFAPTVGRDGYVFHCDCNLVPGLVDLGGLPGVAGLIAPRHLLAVNGRNDGLFTAEAIEDAVAEVQRIYGAAGASDRFAHRWGPQGHRFYADLMWPVVEEVFDLRSRGIRPARPGKAAPDG